MWIMIIAGVAALALLIAYLFGRNHRAKMRFENLKKAVTMLHVYMDPFGPDLKFLEGTALPLFTDGRDLVVRNSIHFLPEDGFESYFFDYLCEVRTAGGAVKREITAALFDFNKDMFPPFFLSADGSGAQPALPGYGALDAAKFPGLPTAAKVYSDSGAPLAALLNPEKTELFMKEPEWNVQAGGQYLLLYSGDSVIAPAAYADYVKRAKLLALRLSV